MFAQELRFPNIYSITRRGKGSIIKRGNVETTWTSIWTKGRRGKILWNSITGSKTAFESRFYARKCDKKKKKENCSSPILLWGWKYLRRPVSKNENWPARIDLRSIFFDSRLRYFPRSFVLEIPRHHLLRWNLHLVHRKIFHIFFFLSTIGKERNIFYFFSFEIRNSDKKFSFIKSNKFTSTTPPLFNVEQTKESSKENESTYSNEIFFPIGGILVKIVRISREVTECCRWREIYSRVSSLPSFLIKYT